MNETTEVFYIWCYAQMGVVMRLYFNLWEQKIASHHLKQK